jgi:hypothetical protein
MRTLLILTQALVLATLAFLEPSHAAYCTTYANGQVICSGSAGQWTSCQRYANGQVVCR